MLGRKTFEIFGSNWPHHEDDWPGVNSAKKYVASNTLTKHDWRNSVFLRGDVGEKIKRLKQQDGPDLQVHGCANLIKTLLKDDLVDAFWLKIFPIALGRGKSLFTEGTIPVAFKLSESKISPNGVIIANYERAGKVNTRSS